MTATPGAVAAPPVREALRAPARPPVRLRPPDHGRERFPPHQPIADGPAAAWVATLLFIAAEAMLFSGLITAFLLYRQASPLWPPFGEPRLPIAVTAVNTSILLLSAVTMRGALRRARAGRRRASHRRVIATALLGTTFLAIQGSEWARLIHWGLTATSSPYGGIFYALIGTHGVHVMAAVIALLALAATGRARPMMRGRLEAASLYWYFVCGVWAVLCPLVYF